MRVMYAGQRIEFTTGYRIDAVKWDEAAQRVKNGCTNKLKQNASQINNDLSKYYADIQTIFKEPVVHLEKGKKDCSFDKRVVYLIVLQMIKYNEQSHTKLRIN
ncbi:hypothetical protein EZS27_043588, partial [termite gut metagenome]